MNQLSIDFSPAARASDPLTSHQAARDAQVNAGTGRALTLKFLARSPMTDFELAAATNWQQTSIGKRRGECVQRGWVEAHKLEGVQVTRPSPSGSAAMVWRITDAGRAVLSQPQEATHGR